MTLFWNGKYEYYINKYDLKFLFVPSSPFLNTFLNTPLSNGPKKTAIITITGYNKQLKNIKMLPNIYTNKHIIIGINFLFVAFCLEIKQ